jgi:hypothetical protein
VIGQGWVTLSSTLRPLGAVHGLAPTLLAALACTAVAALLGGRLWALLLLPQALLWPLLNAQLEGPVLWTVMLHGTAHGLTVTDLFTPACLLVAAWGLRPRPRGRHR